MVAVTRYTAYGTEVGIILRPSIGSLASNGLQFLALIYMSGVVATRAASAAAAGSGMNTVAQGVVSEVSFQLVANVFLPRVLVTAAVEAAHALMVRLLGCGGFLGKWGPSLVALGLMLALPRFDGHIERTTEGLLGQILADGTDSTPESEEL